jgi:hypothetical protein
VLFSLTRKVTTGYAYCQELQKWQRPNEDKKAGPPHLWQRSPQFVEGLETVMFHALPPLRDD